MAVINFISTQWSDKLLDSTTKHYIGVAHCNRDFEGDIEKQGSIVKICGVGDITVSDYTKNADINEPEVLSDTVRTLKIDQAQYFNFQIDDIDRAQANPKLMEEAMKTAAAGLANAADAYVYSLYEFSNYSLTDDAVTAEKFVTLVAEMKAQMIRSGVLDFSDVIIEVSPGIATLLLTGNVLKDADESELGLIGKIHGLKVYVSNNVCVDEDGYHKCIMRSKRAVTFAEKFITKCYTPDHRFADAVKGLHLYGAKIVYPAEYRILDVYYEDEYQY